MLSVRKPRPFPKTLADRVGELDARVREMERQLRVLTDQLSKRTARRRRKRRDSRQLDLGSSP